MSRPDRGERRLSPTIVDVAREAQVSKSTISRVLNGAAGVSLETADRVNRTVERLNYRRNYAARSLRTQQTSLVGVVVPSLNEVYGAQAESIDEVLRAHGVATVVSCSGWSAVQCIERMEMLVGRNVDALILAPPDDRHPLLTAAIRNVSKPVVLIDREVTGAVYDAVLTDQRPGIEAAVQHLVEVGRKSIGLITMTARTRPGRAAITAFGAVLEGLGQEYRPDMVVQSDTFDAASGYRCTEHLLSLGIDALVAGGPMSSMAGVVECLRNKGIDFPVDLSLIGSHENELSSAKLPRLSVVTRDIERIGAIAGELALERLSNPSGPSILRTVETFLVLGDSSDPRALPLASRG